MTDAPSGVCVEVQVPSRNQLIEMPPAPRREPELVALRAAALKSLRRAELAALLAFAGVPPIAYLIAAAVTR